MSVNARFAEAQSDSLIVAFRGDLAMLRDSASRFTSGSSDIGRTISELRMMDAIYNQAVPRWAALTSVRTAAEHTAVGAIKTALDDLFIAFADAMAGLTVPAVVDIGAGYGGTRAQKLASLNRSFPYVVFTLPAGITSKATALVAAIDAFTAG